MKREAFRDSCELARLGIAVWVAKREAFSAFDTWMFSHETGDLWHPRTLDAARAKAVELVGEAAPDAALADPRTEQHMATSIRLFGNTILGGNAVPKLVSGERWVTPEPNNVDELMLVLQENLGLPAPAKSAAREGSP